MYADNDTHMQTWALENASAQGDIAWERWVARVEKLLGDTLDANERTGAGYSMDGGYDAWKAGQTPVQYVQGIPARRAAYHANPRPTWPRWAIRCPSPSTTTRKRWPCTKPTTR